MLNEAFLGRAAAAGSPHTAIFIPWPFFLIAPRSAKSPPASTSISFGKRSRIHVLRVLAMKKKFSPHLMWEGNLASCRKSSVIVLAVCRTCIEPYLCRTLCKVCGNLSLLICFESHFKYSPFERSHCVAILAFFTYPYIRCRQKQSRARGKGL